MQNISTTRSSSQNKKKKFLTVQSLLITVRNVLSGTIPWAPVRFPTSPCMSSFVRPVLLFLPFFTPCPSSYLFSFPYFSSFFFLSSPEAGKFQWTLSNSLCFLVGSKLINYKFTPVLTMFFQLTVDLVTTSLAIRGWFHCMEKYPGKYRCIYIHILCWTFKSSNEYFRERKSPFGN